MQKCQLIKLQDKFILINDEEPKIGDWYNSNLGTNKLGSTTRNVEQYRQKLIADNDVSELPSIDFSLLNEKDCKKIGYVDVKKLAIDDANLVWCDNFTLENEQRELNGHFVGFQEGFKTAHSFNKEFSLEDMSSFAAFCSDNHSLDDSEKPNLFWQPIFKEGEKVSMNKMFLNWQSLQQKSWDVEVEMEYLSNDGSWKDVLLPSEWEADTKVRSKITNNSIKVIKLL